MKGCFFILGFLVLLVSCASEKPLQLESFADVVQVSLQETKLQGICSTVYPQGKWQFVHAIEFRVESGTGSSVVGVTVLDGNKLSCALMTIEGFTLFEARLTDRLEVLRAVPPFDKPEFATGLMDDVRAIFIRPQGEDIRYGYREDNTAFCRMTSMDGQVTDIIPTENDCWRIKTYNARQQLTRTIIAGSCRRIDSTSIPEELVLTVPGPAGYTLNMTLINTTKQAM